MQQRQHHHTSTSSSSSSRCHLKCPARRWRQPAGSAAAALTAPAVPPPPRRQVLLHAHSQDHQQHQHHPHHPQQQQLAAFSDLPLLTSPRRRVLVTAPRQYATKLTALLVEAGTQPLWLPGVAITRLTDPEHLQQLDAALAQLGSYSHVAFTSKNGILAVLERLADLHGGSHEAAAEFVRASGAKLCALGADGAVLQAAGLQVDVSPREASTKGLAAELAATGQAVGARVLCPVPHVEGGLVEPPVVPRFLEALAAGGAEPERVPAYVTTLGLPLSGSVGGADPAVGPAAAATGVTFSSSSSSVSPLAQLEAQLLSEGHVHAIAFSSTAEAQGLCLLLGGRKTVAQAVQQHGVVLAAHGPYTAAGVADVLGLPVPVVSRDWSSFHGLVAALAAALA